MARGYNPNLEKLFTLIVPAPVDGGRRGQGPGASPGSAPQRVRRYCHLGEGWKALRDLPQAPAAGTMEGWRGGWWASARSGLEVEEAAERGAGP